MPKLVNNTIPNSSPIPTASPPALRHRVPRYRSEPRPQHHKKPVRPSPGAEPTSQGNPAARNPCSLAYFRKEIHYAPPPIPHRSGLIRAATVRVRPCAPAVRGLRCPEELSLPRRSRRFPENPLDIQNPRARMLIGSQNRIFLPCLAPLPTGEGLLLTAMVAITNHPNVSRKIAINPCQYSSVLSSPQSRQFSPRS